MNQKERAEEFLKKLSELCEKYDFEITAEGSPTLLYDEIEGGWIEFGRGFCDTDYIIYED